jgi:hypothetical protein
LEPRLILPLKDWDGDVAAFPCPPAGCEGVRIETRAGEKVLRNLTLVGALPGLQERRRTSLINMNQLVAQSFSET